MVCRDFSTFFFTLVVAVCASQEPFDSRNEGCAAFRPLSQTGCQACCAAAVVAATSARACLHDDRNVVYSMKRVWDCAYNGILSCDDGVIPSQFFSWLYAQDAHAGVLVPVTAATEGAIAAPNASACVGYTNENIAAIKIVAQVNATVEAAGALEDEIRAYGPTVAVIHFQTPADWNAFKNYQTPVAAQQTLFPLHSYTGTNATGIAHCVSVIGWGADYWLVQNSFGADWGANGIGRLARLQWGVERAWYSITPAHLHCGEGRGGCVTRPAAVSVVAVAVTVATDAAAVPNSAIMSITVVCVLVIGALVFICYRPLVAYQLPDVMRRNDCEESRECYDDGRFERPLYWSRDS